MKSEIGKPRGVNDTDAESYARIVGSLQVLDQLLDLNEKMIAAKIVDADGLVARAVKEGREYRPKIEGKPTLAVREAMERGRRMDEKA